MNIAIGKFGKSVKFKPENWTAHGGDNEAPIFFQKLAYYNPEITFYMVGKNDLKNLSTDEYETFFPHKNVIDIWSDFKLKKDDDTGLTWIIEKMKNISIDGGIFYAGPISNNANIPNLIYTQREPHRIAKVLETFKNYAAPLIYYLNDVMVPYITLAPDPRYVPLQGKDLFNREKRILSQFVGKFDHKHIKSYEYEDQINKATFSIETTYNRIETVFFLDKEKRDVTQFEKTKKLMIVLNEGGNGVAKRGPELKKYVLDHIDDVEIYGKWDEEWLKDSRFKGPLKFIELQKKLQEVKYTFCIPIQKGWVTSKFWEMIYNGIIPFLHPNYDTQNNLKCPEFLRVKDPKDLYKKIDFLEKNPESYQKLIKTLNDMMKEEYFDGSFIIKETMQNLYDVLGIKEEYKLWTGEIEKYEKLDTLNLFF